MTKYPKVAVVILNWNGRFFLEKFLPSVFNSSYPNVEFVIGDNNSEDDSIDYVKENFPKFTILTNSENLGFAGGYNAILSRIEADYYVLLNSDVEVSQNWIEPIIAMMEKDPLLAAVQPKIQSFHTKGFFEHAGGAGGFIDSFGFPFCRGRIFEHIEKDNGQYDDAREIFWATGAALFIKSHIWQQAEGFDADFFAHMEEIDLCWRLKRMGYKIGYCPSSIVYHVGGGTLHTSNPNKTYLNFRNNLQMMQKNLPTGQLIWKIFIRFWFDLAALIRFLFEGRPKDAWAVSRAHQYFFKNFIKTGKKRKKYPNPENKIGQYKYSIVWEHFMNKVRRFSDLKDNNFHK